MVMTWEPHHAKKGDPVAVVYYRCDLNQKECNPLSGLYYVHNAVALEDLPTKEGGAWVSHIPTWPQSQTEPNFDNLYICGAEKATQWAQGSGGPQHCHDDTTTKQPWVVKAIYTYPVGYTHPLDWHIGQPIAWKVTKGATIEGPHNGTFRCFKSGSQHCDSDITKTITKAGKPATLQGGTLRFWHYANISPGPDEDARKAKSWEKLTLQSGEVTVTGTDKITIVQRLI